MEERKRDTLGKFSSSSSRISNRSDFFKWFNDGRKLEDPPQVGFRNDHCNYEFLDVGAEAELKDNNKSDMSQSWKMGRRIVELEVLAKGMYVAPASVLSTSQI